MKINVSEIQALCEANTFTKGMLLAESRAVRQLKISGHDVTAKVQGTETYHVQVQTQPYLMAGCTCPAAEYQEFCKHAVAVALSVNSGIAQDGVDHERAVVREYLLAQGEAAILELLLGYLEEDHSAWQQILTKMALSQKSVSYRELKKLVTNALPRKHIWSWREVGHYFNFAEEQLNIVFEVAQALDVDQQWKLINYVIERLNTVLEGIDDSHGDRFGIEALINNSMPALFEQLPWNEEQKARWIFEQLTPEFDVFPSIEEHFDLHWLTNPIFLTLCREAIEHSIPTTENIWDLMRWAKPLIDNAQNWQEVVSIKQKIAYRYSDFLEITSLYIENDEALNGEYWLAKAKKMAKGYERERCDEVQIKLHVGLGEISQAWQLHNRMFSESPSYNAYQRLIAFKAEHEIEDEALLSRIEQTLMSANASDALVYFYIDQQAWEKACDLASKRRISMPCRLSLADLIVNDKPESTLDYYLQAVVDCIEQTNNSAYKDAINLLKRLEVILKAHPTQLAELYGQIAQLAASYKRKRNMLTQFQQHYSQYIQ